MQHGLSDGDLRFQRECRRFIEENYPQVLRDRQDLGYDMTREDYMSWHRILAAKGWIAPSWPVEWGGTAWTVTQKYIWTEEQARADTLRLPSFGLDMVAPAIIAFGTDEQKARFLPATYRGEIWWCQGYSEPEAGSDLASLRTSAVRHGDSYVVNGQKTWTTFAQFADWGFFLVRTDPTAKSQSGISFLLIDMRTPGITIRPLLTLEGGHEVNEVWLEDVVVPVTNRIHHENAGWTCAKYLLQHERTTVAQVARSRRGLAVVERMARSMGSRDTALVDQGSFRRKLSAARIELLALEATQLRVLAAQQKGEPPGPASSLLKIKGSEMQQRITELGLEAIDHYAAPFVRPPHTEADRIGAEGVNRVPLSYLNQRKTTIYGGSNEIQRNILAKLVLGL